MRVDRRLGRHLFVLLLGLSWSCPSFAQQSPSDTADEERPPTFDSLSGYIDGAVPMNQIRLRYDLGYDNRQPTRGEFFYARTGTNGPGLPLPESSVDFQDVSLYLERKFGQRLSAFVELPVRFGNFEVNTNRFGLADITTGFKYAFLQNEYTTASLQFRLYVPTGDSQRGLGTNHVSFEPAFLLLHRFSDKLQSESEVRMWVPTGGTREVQGESLRYGTGLSYKVWDDGCRWVAPVAEVVGWTFFDGQTTPPTPDGTSTFSKSAAGDTIVNAKLGVRFRLGERSELYAGYGRALTGEVMYKDIYRFEFRILY